MRIPTVAAGRSVIIYGLRIGVAFGAGEVRFNMGDRPFGGRTVNLRCVSLARVCGECVKSGWSPRISPSEVINMSSACMKDRHAHETRERANLRTVNVVHAARDACSKFILHFPYELISPHVNTGTCMQLRWWRRKCRVWLSCLVCLSNSRWRQSGQQTRQPSQLQLSTQCRRNGARPHSKSIRIFCCLTWQCRQTSKLQKLPSILARLRTSHRIDAKLSIVRFCRCCRSRQRSDPDLLAEFIGPPGWAKVNPQRDRSTLEVTFPGGCWMCGQNAQKARAARSRVCCASLQRRSVAVRAQTGHHGHGLPPPPPIRTQGKCMRNKCAPVRPHKHTHTHTQIRFHFNCAGRREDNNGPGARTSTHRNAACV